MTMLDRISEEISHFIGLLQIRADQMRQRETYDPFNPINQDVADPDLDAPVKKPFAAPYELLGFDPWVDYRGPGPEPFSPFKWRNPHDHDPEKLAYQAGQPGSPDHLDVRPSGVGAPAGFVPPELEPPGSVVTYASQAIALSDNDYFGVGGHQMVFAPEPIDDAELLDAAETALSRSPLGNLEKPGSADAIVELIKTAASQLEGIGAGSGGGFQVVVHQAEILAGTYVNGVLTDVVPDLADYRPVDEEEDPDEDTDTGNAWVHDDGSIVVEASVTLETGNNTVVNDAILQNLWTAATVTAVVGDHFEVNAIIQTNVLWDADAITSAVGNWTLDGTVNEIFNIATFDRTDPAKEGGASKADKGGFPSHWSVTEVKGDLMVMSWLEQFVFMSDNDVGILSSSGVTTSVKSGDNLGVNYASIFELGFSYDLIIVGGSSYDASIIEQTNVLFDNDVIGAVSGFQTKGGGTVSTSGNLLWNNATIHNVGGGDRFGDLPKAYRDAAKNLGDGKGGLSRDVLTDEAFSGLGTLRVLYIRGDLLNLQYVKQTSVVGDSDQIGLAMDALKPHLDSGWSLATGGNTLVNNATIIDLDSFGKTYVGGQQYNQETLIQAEFISSKPEFGGRNPDALVNEAVLFLDDSMLASASHEAAPGVFIPSEHDGPSDGGLQSMIGH